MPEDGTDRESSSELAGRLRNGDNEAAGLLVERLSPWLKKMIDRKIGPRLRRRIDAEDVMQSAFWSFCRRTSDGQYEFEHSGALCRLLLTIAENKVRRAGNHHTRECRDFRREAVLDSQALEMSDGEWEQTRESMTEAVDEVAYVVDRLPARDAEFFRRRYFWGHSAGQISTETGWSLATVKRVLKHAVEAIRDRIENNSE